MHYYVPIFLGHSVVSYQSLELRDDDVRKMFLVQARFPEIRVMEIYLALEDFVSSHASALNIVVDGPSNAPAIADDVMPRCESIAELGDEKYAHLLKLEGASENLKLFKADLLNYESVRSAISGCNAVFHVASPVPSTTSENPEVEVIEPAVKGTTNVLEASLEAKVERVVYVSSVAAICMYPNLPKDKVIDESDWSDKEYCKNTKNWYCYSKTEAEEQAADFMKRTGLSVVRVCPTLVLGPILQSTTVNASSLVLLKLLKGCESLENKLRWIVDARDLADATLLAYEKTEAEGRYLCTSHSIKAKDLVEKLKSIYPNYNYPTNFVEVDDEMKFSTEKLQNLGWKYKPLEETLIDSVESYKEAGLLESK